MTKRPAVPIAARVRTPAVLQMEAVECGAAALAIVLAYYGRFIPLEEMRVACGVSRDGSKATNILKAARSFGMVAKGLKKEPDELRSLRFPAILFWNFAHYVVLEGFEKDRVYLNDPAVGRRAITPTEMDHAFTGVVLAIEPGTDFQKGGRPRSAVTALRERIAASKTALLFVVLAGLALIVPTLANPSFTRVYVDEVLIRGSRDWARPLLALMLAAAVVSTALVWLQETHLRRLASKLSLVWSGRFFWHVLRLPHQFFTQRYAGEVGSRTSIDDRVALLLSGELASAVLSLVLVVAYAALMIRYDAALAAVAIVAAVVNLGCLRVVMRRRVDLSAVAAQERGRLLGISMSGLQTIETLKASGTESDFFSRWAAHSAKSSNAESRLESFSTMVSVVPPLLSSLTLAAIYCVGGYRSMTGMLTIGTLVAFQTLLGGFSQPLTQLVNLGGRIQEIGADLARSEDVLHHALDPDVRFDDSAAEGVLATPLRLSGKLELKEIAFGYSRLDPPLIERFDLTVNPGQRVALVGTSGSGKSTLARLICGLHVPFSGEILFEDRRRDEIPRHVLTSSLAYVDQDILLFAGTVRENLTLWNESIPEPALFEALRDAAVLDELVVRGGLDAEIREGGANLSGGQRQRIEIARALVTRPSILVLDEATSALDATTERIIDENLRRRGCTCIIVAHRLSTVRDADEIVVLERGKVIERGTHETLMRGGAYRRLIEA